MAEVREMRVGDLGWSLAVGSVLKFAVVLDALEKGMATQFSGNPLQYYWCFPESSVGKESTCNMVDLSSIPGSERSAGEGIGYPLQYS